MFQELHQVPVLLIRAHEEPRWVPTRAARAVQLKHVLVLERLPDRDLAAEELARGAVGENLDGDRAPVPRAFVHVGEEPEADPLVSVDFVSVRRIKSRK